MYKTYSSSRATTMQPKTLNLAPTPWPPGFNFFPNFRPPHKTLTFHQFLVLLLTFTAYSAFHASRKPPSIVKSVLGPEIQTLNTNIHATTAGSNSDPSQSSENPVQTAIGWAPFNGRRGPHHLGELDLSFLLAYSIGMYFAGHIGDSFDLRLFLTVGMVGSGFLVIFFGLGYFLDVHSFTFYVIVQVLCGLFQSIGWPCVVAVVGNWFGKSKRGLILGIWNSHASVGNIIGSIVASSVLGFGWGWCFVLPGTYIIIVAILVYFFLVVSPDNLGFEFTENEVEMSVEAVALVTPEKSELEVGEGLVGLELEGDSVAIGFLEAWRLPGVAPFAFSLFFSKLVAYTFLYWLPFYLRHTAIAGMHLSHGTAGILSTIFDIGGVVGGILAGFMSDTIEAPAVSSLVFLLLSVPALVFYRTYGSVSMLINIALMFISGLLVNGPYSLITTAVATDLGTQSVIKGNSRALATVSAIIDGTGSVGAAIGPLLAGYVSTRGWNSVFFMLIVSILLAGLLLIHLVKNEIKGKLNEGKWLWFSLIAH